MKANTFTTYGQKRDYIGAIKRLKSNKNTVSDNVTAGEMSK